MATPPGIHGPALAKDDLMTRATFRKFSWLTLGLIELAIFARIIVGFIGD
jgi:hypothetical protein